MTRETFEGAALRCEQEAQDERKGSLTDRLWRAARGARKALERADALLTAARRARNPTAGLLASETELRMYVREIAGLVAEADPAPEPATHRCGHVASPGGVDPATIREPLRSHLAKQDCPECRRTCARCGHPAAAHGQRSPGADGARCRDGVCPCAGMLGSECRKGVWT